MMEQFYFEFYAAETLLKCFVKCAPEGLLKGMHGIII